jgi:hypothetical protein
MNWHRAFGLILSDFFAGTPFVVEVEKDLSAKKQLLDVVIIRRRRGKLTRRPPDDLDDLVAHNLITFKSHHEALDDWSLKELTGHYVNYRKQVSPSMRALLPEDQFRLYAICSRFPQHLDHQARLAQQRQGVYECRRGTDLIRVIVAGQLPRQEHNAALHLFSASLEEVNYGRGHFQQHSDFTSTVLQGLLETYRQEGIHVVYTLEDFHRDYLQEKLLELPPEKRKALFAKLPVESRLEGLSAEEIKEYLKRLEEMPPTRKRKKPN